MRFHNKGGTAELKVALLHVDDGLDKNTCLLWADPERITLCAATKNQ
jgi:hypothetical protein